MTPEDIFKCNFLKNILWIILLKFSLWPKYHRGPNGNSEGEEMYLRTLFPIPEDCFNLLLNLRALKAPVTQNSTSKSRTRSHENLVDVVVSGNFWSILAWSCFVRGMAVVGCSTAEALPKHCLSTALARKNPCVSDKPLNTRYFPWYQRVTPVRWPCSARDRPLNFPVLPRLPKF